MNIASFLLNALVVTLNPLAVTLNSFQGPCLRAKTGEDGC